MSDNIVNYMGKDGFHWWQGVVEDRMDPKKLGRVRVRILGIHTEEKDLIPTEELPWAYPMQPITSAAMSGMGVTPLGLVEGTWVVGFFRDGPDKQQPIVMGSIGGIPEEEADKEKGFNDPRDTSYEEFGDVLLKDAPKDAGRKEGGKGEFKNQEYPDGEDKYGQEHGAQLGKEGGLENEDEGKTHPKEEYLEEPDTNRLARNEKVNETIVELKRKTFPGDGLRLEKIDVADCDNDEFDCGVTNESKAAKGTEKNNGGDNPQTSTSFTSLKEEYRLWTDEPKNVNDAEVSEGDGQWTEPETPYGKIDGEDIEEREVNDAKFQNYPYNHVFESESGHIIEIDDTPNSERLHIYHRTGTFQEIHPNGDKVTKVVRDNYTSVLRDNHVHVDGHANVTIDKALKIYVNREKHESSKEEGLNFDIHVGENANLNIYMEKGHVDVRVLEGDVNCQLDKGDMNIRQDAGDYNHFVHGDYNLEVTGDVHTVVGANRVTEIGGSSDTRVDGKFHFTNVTEGYLETHVEGDVKHTIHGKKEQDIDKNWQTKVGKNYELDTGKEFHSISGQSHFIKAGKDTNIKSSLTNNFQAGTDTNIKSGTTAKYSSRTSTNIVAGAVMNIVGAPLNLNGGGAPAGPAAAATHTGHEDKPESRIQGKTRSEGPQTVGSEQDTEHTRDIDPQDGTGV